VRAADRDAGAGDAGAPRVRLAVAVRSLAGCVGGFVCCTGGFAGRDDGALAGPTRTRPMLALVKVAPGPGLELRDVPMPEVGINDVLIRVHKTGICGTDLHIDAWDNWASTAIEPPMVIGHEFVGDIVDVGSNVSDFHAGDLVSGEGHVTCGRCRHCMAGQRHLCANTVGLGVGRDGSFAEYVALPMTNIWHHWAGIDEDVAAIFDPFGNAVHTALAFEVMGEDVLISGAGPIGLMAIGVVRHAGARHVVVSEPNAFRRALAEKMGATMAIDPTTRTLKEAQHDLGMVEGFDVALEMSGNAHALRSAIDNMAHGGRIAQLGIPTAEITLDVNAIVFNQLTLRGIYGREMYETWYQSAVLISAGLDITPVITDRFPYTEFEAAFAAARSGDSGKVIMDWQGAGT
jgi:threonine 3-dehydrogenase